MSQIALITGATSGIGKSTAYKLAAKGYNLIIAGRREERLEAIEAELMDTYSIKVIKLKFDVRVRAAVKLAIDSLPPEWQKIDVLINNAGLASGLSDIQDGDIDDWEAMIDTNIKGLLYVTRSVSPLMIKHKSGHIINISSIAGKEVYPKGNVYCASKHAVDALNKSMRIDLLPHGIKVTSINPGLLETEFSLVRFKGDEERARQVYKGFTPLQPEDVAEVILFALSRPPHVCLNEILLTPTAQATARDVIREG
jgi:3-hydroxy acid dehydrogenase/malonic semialdehyde reductase